MRITNVNITMLKINRAIEIMWVLSSNAMVEFFARSPIGKALTRRAKRKGGLKRGYYTYNTAERIRFTIEELGPTYVKFGQILADRPDIVSSQFREQLKKLQSNASPFSDQLAMAIVTNELQKPVNQVFKNIEPSCFAAASLGQVYRATLMDNSDVVVKIQRPHIEHKIEIDLYLMRYLAKQLAIKYPEMAAINIVALVDDFAEGITGELDYRNEAANNHRFIEMFKDVDSVYIPHVYHHYTTRNMIIMEQIRGVTPDSKKALLDAGLDPHIVAETGANAMIKMILEHGFFHADPHPGNLFVMKNNVVAFIDFGMIGILKPKDIDFLAEFSLGFATNNSHLVAVSLMELCDVKFFDRISELEFDIDKMMSRSSGMSVASVDIAKSIQTSIHIILKYNFKIPSGIFMLVKSLTTIQKVGEALDPNLSLTPIIIPYAKNVLKKKFSSKKVFDEIYDTITDYIRVIRDLPNDVGEILYKMKQGTIRHEIKLEDDSIFVNTFRAMSLRIAYVVVLVGVFIGSSIMITFGDVTHSGKVALYCSLILILILLAKWLVKRK